MKDRLQTYSVLGDSISTFQGYTPAAGVFYGPGSRVRGGVASAEDTWWMQVIRGRGGKLLVNDSWAGSTVSEEGHFPAVSPQRLRRLGREGWSPDCILVFTGLNDWLLYVDPAHFAAEYRRMLHTMRQMYPAASICCGTFPGGTLSSSPTAAPIGAMRQEAYNRAIRAAVREAGCHLADLAARKSPYESIDGTHPTRRGMTQLARLWLDCLPIY